MTHGQMRLAEDACTRAIEFNAKEATAYELRGYVYLQEQRFERAESDFRVALKLQPGNDQTLAGYAQSLSGLGKFDEAIVQFDKAIALAPRIAAYHSARCWAQAATGRNLPRAVADCNEALTLAPGTPGPLNGRGLAELRMEKYQLALRDYGASLAGNEHQPSAFFGRGLTKLALHQIAAGKSDIVRARQDDPEIDSLFVTLGLLSRECAAGDTSKCPAGFPALPPQGKWLAAWLTP
jgi:tetratricopeptide (TPR) repeat protein